MRKIVVLSGAGMSAESGLHTFRDANGLWNNYSIYEVATPDAWATNKQLVLDFYNHRRLELQNAEPNVAHRALVELEGKFEVFVITQNVDNLHERAGSSNVLHLHGELTKARGEFTYDSIEDIGYNPILLGQKNYLNEQYRPHIVWFGEEVPCMEKAIQLCASTDLFLVIGTSLQVYPAAGLIQTIPMHAPVYLIDPKADEMAVHKSVTIVKEKAGIAVPALVKKILDKGI